MINRQAWLLFGVNAHPLARPGRSCLVGAWHPDAQRKAPDLHPAGRREPNRAPGSQALPLHGGPIAGVEVADHPALTAQVELGVLSRYPGVFEDHVVVLAAPQSDGRPKEGQQVLPARWGLNLQDAEHSLVAHSACVSR